MATAIQEGAERLWTSFRRTKKVQKESIMETPLRRCLSTFDLILMGVGNMTGAGIYVLTGTVIRDKAGPAVFLSYMIAAITAFLNALCYSELSSRIPKAGSAYTYTYIAGGELLAFVIGWSVILEYVLSAASVARGWSGTIDAMARNAMSNGTVATIGRFPENKWLADYPDFVAFGIIILLTALLIAGPKVSVNFNTVITTLNILVILIATSIMFYFAKPQLLTVANHHGGFMPYHLGGVIAGAGTCFYSFIGFDAITVSSEEAKTPAFSLPIATAVSVGFVGVLFVIGTLSLVMYVPWWTIDRRAPFTSAFTDMGITWATYVTGVGSLLGISASLFTTMYALPRVVYAMASDGLIFEFLSFVLPSTQVPILAMLVFGLLTALLALLFDIQTLADFLSIGTLVAYTIVSINVIIIRYRCPREVSDLDDQCQIEEGNEKKALEADARSGYLKSRFQNIPILRNFEPGNAPVLGIVSYLVFTACLCSLLFVGTEYLYNGAWWAILLVIVLILLDLAAISMMCMHEQFINFSTFKVPLVPLIPCICIFMNISLIVKLSPMTWVRFSLWLLIGLIIYFFYGIRHSAENRGLSEQTAAPVVSYTTQVVNSGPEPVMDEKPQYPQPSGEAHESQEATLLEQE